MGCSEREVEQIYSNLLFSYGYSLGDGLDQGPPLLGGVLLPLEGEITGLPNSGLRGVGRDADHIQGRLKAGKLVFQLGFPVCQGAVPAGELFLGQAIGQVQLIEPFVLGFDLFELGASRLDQPFLFPDGLIGGGQMGCDVGRGPLELR